MVPVGARCGVHASAAAVDVCQRCGVFLCGDCLELLGEESYCAACAAKLSTPASPVARAALVVAGLSWLTFGIGALGYRAPLFAVLFLAAPGPGALAAMVLGIIEWNRIKRGDAPTKGRRFAVAALLVAAPLLLLMALLVLYGTVVRR